MKTYNLQYTNIKMLEQFINKNCIDNERVLLVQIFSGILDKNLLQEISQTIIKLNPLAKIIGATTDGEIFSNEVYTNTIVISFTVFEHSNLTISCIDNISINNSYQVGAKIASYLYSEKTKVFILFGDGLNINGEEFLNGVQSKAPNVIVSGGLAGDNANFHSTYVICNDQVLEKGVVGVSIESDILQVYTNYSFAWSNIGREFIVDKSHKGIVYQIDGMTPVELYAKYLGQEVADLLPNIGIEFPLIIQNDNINMARAVLSKNDDGSLVFAGNIPEGSRVKFGIGNVDNLLSRAVNLSKEIASNPSESIFIYSCMARRRFLDKQASTELQYLSQIASCSGFFTYGEFFTNNNISKLLNETMTVLSLSEDSVLTPNIIKYKKEESQSLTPLRALSHLVNVTSAELEDLNNNLENRVQIELQKNIENEKKIFDSMKMASLGDMIANIAHQWRQPLSVITTSASGMQLNKEIGTLTDELFGDYTSTIISQAMYLSDTINTFRDFIREEHNLCNVILQQEIDTSLKLIEVVLKDNSIELINKIDYDTPVTVQLITGELSQVIINIMNNAKDVLKEREIEHKSIILDMEVYEDKVFLTIEDNAGGIPEDVLPRIFEPYFTTKHKSNGTGIGLHMSYDIITKHFNGELYAKNTQNGAKFYISLPIVT